MRSRFILRHKYMYYYQKKSVLYSKANNIITHKIWNILIDASIYYRSTSLGMYMLLTTKKILLHFTDFVPRIWIITFRYLSKENFEFDKSLDFSFPKLHLMKRYIFI